MRMFKKVLAGFVAAAMVATMAGCGSSNSSTKDSDQIRQQQRLQQKQQLLQKFLTLTQLTSRSTVSHHLLLILTSVLFRQHVKKKARS